MQNQRITDLLQQVHEAADELHEAASLLEDAIDELEPTNDKLYAIAHGAIANGLNIGHRITCYNNPTQWFDLFGAG